jgi:cytochrome c oxidase subunit 3
VNTLPIEREHAHTHPQRLAPNSVVGMLLFLATEVMFFAGLMSAFIVTRAGVVWPPADQPRLPVEATALNTCVLFASGLMSRKARQAFAALDCGRAQKLLNAAIGFGALFVAFQGYEWVRLLSFGLTVRSGTYGAFFYLIVGAHALHAVAALLMLGYCSLRLRRGDLTRPAFSAAQLFWYFVVLLWPILYLLVYVL